MTIKKNVEGYIITSEASKRRLFESDRGEITSWGDFITKLLCQIFQNTIQYEP